jgi:hypothetical protein
MAASSHAAKYPINIQSLSHTSDVATVILLFSWLTFLRKNDYNTTSMEKTHKNKFTVIKSKSRDSSVGIALGYGLGNRGSRVPFPAGTGNFSLHHRVQNGSGAHPASYPMGTRGSFPGGKEAAGA